MGVRLVADRSSHRAPMFSYADENVYACLDWAGYCRIRLEVRDRFPPIIAFFWGKDDPGDVLEILNGGVGWEELIPIEEVEVREGPELDCLMISFVLGLLA